MNHKIRILLVEDNLDKRAEFRHSIHSHERLELCAETGKEEEGLNLLKTKTPDVVILDLELEEGNGITFAEKMRAMPISQPFVVVTTNNCSSSISQYLRYDLKIDFIFQKTNASYTANQVLDIIEKYINTMILLRLLMKTKKSYCEIISNGNWKIWASCPNIPEPTI